MLNCDESGLRGEVQVSQIHFRVKLQGVFKTIGQDEISLRERVDREEKTAGDSVLGLQQFRGLLKKEEQKSMTNNSWCKWRKSGKWMYSLSKVHWSSNIRLFFFSKEYGNRGHMGPTFFFMEF